MCIRDSKEVDLTNHLFLPGDSTSIEFHKTFAHQLSPSIFPLFLVYSSPPLLFPETLALDTIDHFNLLFANYRWINGI